MRLSSSWEGDAFDPECPTRIVLDRVGDKWTVLIIGILDEGPKRFSEIRLAIGGITPKVLTSTLRSLVADGLVTREVFAEVPPRVEYELTDLGRSLQEPVAALRRWAELNVAAISDNRSRVAR
ncbi:MULTISPECIES: winged helix-turn-helix transcriptional regulator [Brevibacterium]|uniref:Transcriptional regulator n=1 Tax=Brevibacterium aurantiacum TaxID=273384 RepID=A0A1D7W241_BREAU|nr:MULTISPECIES: helix-turn-helix domain-containing protein [Brevibacterium]MDN5549905.1 helix-turn-helix transcriptional regulator [Brevibacterium sp.]AOP53032.1 Transcriptional regulator, HxlR family [Brevibacterium aurantiacum]AZL05289.1 transcriptional regulator [Brevibacterium aurantiacum]AZL08874.1 transcriptional regulator [Brevibacterium aurantiacum]MDN5594107.1 helix-turn-helix transcriptional regulator [Brevibacterium sp.]